jgi:hypothetical protein
MSTAGSTRRSTSTASPWRSRLAPAASPGRLFPTLRLAGLTGRGPGARRLGTRSISSPEDSSAPTAPPRQRGAGRRRELHRCDFAMAEGGGAEIGPTKRGKGMKIMAIVDRHGLPLSVSTQAANHHEVRLVQLCFDFYMIEAKPETLIGDRPYDSDPLDDELRKDGIEMGRAAPIQSPQARHARWTTASAICQALVGRTLLCLDTMAAPHSCPLGAFSEELP